VCLCCVEAAVDVSVAISPEAVASKQLAGSVLQSHCCMAYCALCGVANTAVRE
jgi:hypothetical protein